MYKFNKIIGLAAILIVSAGLVSSNVSAHQLKNDINIEKLVETLPSSERDSSRLALLRLHEEAKNHSVDLALKSVHFNTDFDDEMSTMSTTCTVIATVQILEQDAEVSATVPTCAEAYDMLSDLINHMAP